MKKIYTAPAVVANGSVVRETLNGQDVASESGTQFKSLAPGGVGYYL